MNMAIILVLALDSIVNLAIILIKRIIYVARILFQQVFGFEEQR